METVNPMPPNMATPINILQLTPCGRRTILSFIASHENKTIPTTLPTDKPANADSPTPENRSGKVTPDILMPALAKANNGMMKYFTSGASVSSIS